MPHISRFLKFTSDRDGFDDMRVAMLKDGSSIVNPDEYDTPPPSKKSLGGEGDIAQGELRQDGTSTDTPSGSDNPTVYITAAGGITPSTHPFMLVVGSNSNVTISANPQIVRGKQNQILTLFGTGSSITLQNGNGVATMGSSILVLNSGYVATFIYNTGGTVWQETSRDRVGG